MPVVIVRPRPPTALNRPPNDIGGEARAIDIDAAAERGDPIAADRIELEAESAAATGIQIIATADDEQDERIRAATARTASRRRD